MAKIVAQRHVLAHDYRDIQQEKMWLLVIQNIPELIAKLQPLTIPPPPNSLILIPQLKYHDEQSD